MADEGAKGTRHRICRYLIYRICDLVYYRVRVVVGEGLSGYPQIGTRGTEGYGQHSGRCSSNDIYTNPLLFLFLFLLFIVIVVVGFAEVVIVRIRSHAGKLKRPRHGLWTNHSTRDGMTLRSFDSAALLRGVHSCSSAV